MTKRSLRDLDKKHNLNCRLKESEDGKVCPQLMFPICFGRMSLHVGYFFLKFNIKYHHDMKKNLEIMKICSCGNSIKLYLDFESSICKCLQGWISVQNL